MKANDSTYKYWSPSRRRAHGIREARRVRWFTWNDFSEGELVSSGELARRLDRAPKTIANWVTTQGLPRIRVDSKYMFILAEVVDWAEDKPFITDRQFSRLKNFDIEN